MRSSVNDYDEYFPSNNHTCKKKRGNVKIVVLFTFSIFLLLTVRASFEESKKAVRTFFAYFLTHQVYMFFGILNWFLDLMVASFERSQSSKAFCDL